MTRSDQFCPLFPLSWYGGAVEGSDYITVLALISEAYALQGEAGGASWGSIPLGEESIRGVLWKKYRRKA